MYVCMYIMYMYVCTYMYVCMYVYVFVCLFVCLSVCLFVCLFVCVPLYIYIYIYCACIRVCKHTHTRVFNASRMPAGPGGLSGFGIKARVAASFACRAWIRTLEASLATVHAVV